MPMPQPALAASLAWAGDSSLPLVASWEAQLAVVAITVTVIVLSVLLHYEGLTLLQRNLGHLHLPAATA